MNPVVLQNGRSELLFDPKDGCLRLRFDGHGLLQMLSKREAQALRRALHEYVYPSTEIFVS